MDRKGISIVAASLVFLLGWFYLVNNYLAKPNPNRPRPSTNAPVAAADSAAKAATKSAAKSAADAAAAAPATSNVGTASSVAGPRPLPPMRSSATEQTLSIDTPKVRAVFTSEGGGLKYVELKDYPAKAGRTKKTDGPVELAALNKPAFLPAFSFFNAPGEGSDETYALSKTATGVKAEKVLPNGLKVVKEFSFSTNYEFNASVRVENPGSQAVAIPTRELVIGTGSPMDPHETSDNTGAFWFNGERSEHFESTRFANSTFGCIPGTPLTEITAGSSNVVWAAVHNRFFALIAVPDHPAEQVVVRNYPLPRPSKEQLEADGKLNANPHAYQTAFLIGGTNLAPGKTVEHRFRVYAGPKEYFTLSRIDPQLDLVMDFSGITGFFAKGLLLSLNGIHNFIPSYGWSIVAITIIIKGLFWPLTAASTRSMKRMQAIQPQLQALREKYKDNPQKLNEKTLAVMKENKVNPAAGCLPMLIQFPVFIGFFFMLRTAIELRGESFLWAADLSQPDTLFVIPGLGFIPFLGVQGVGLPFNLFPILMGMTSLYLASLTPPSPQMDPAQQKMMKYMPVFFVAFLYNYSSGLTLYWTVQNLITVLQTKYTKMNDSTDSKGSGGVTVVKARG
jgi:YidC/Oxa1 family membrane protein insertase